MDLLRGSQMQNIVGFSWWGININSMTKSLRKKDNVLRLVESKKDRLLWGIQIGRNCQIKSLPTITYQFELLFTLDMSEWYCNMTRHNQNAEVGSTTAPVLFAYLVPSEFYLFRSKAHGLADTWQLLKKCKLGWKNGFCPKSLSRYLYVTRDMAKM